MAAVPQSPYLLLPREVTFARREPERRARGVIAMWKDGRLTRHGQAMLLVGMLVAAGMAMTVYIIGHPKDNPDIKATVGAFLAFLTAIGVAVLNQGRRNEDILHDQNVKLQKIEGTAVDAPVGVLEKEITNQRHTFNGVLQFLTTRLAELEAENRGYREKIANLELQSRTNAIIAEKLAERASPPAAPPPDGLGTAGQL